jgi:hypothetical protein
MKKIALLAVFGLFVFGCKPCNTPAVEVGDAEPDVVSKPVAVAAPVTSASTAPAVSAAPVASASAAPAVSAAPVASASAAPVASTAKKTPAPAVSAKTK